MAARKINPLVAELKAKFEGLTVRKDGESLKVVKQVAKERKPQMPKQINISIHPFGAYREQLWIGKVVDGEFRKDQPLYKVPTIGGITAKSKYDGQFGKSSTSQDWEITVPDDFHRAIAKSRLNKDTIKVRTEWEVLHA